MQRKSKLYNGFIGLYMVVGILGTIVTILNMLIPYLFSMIIQNLTIQSNEVVWEIKLFILISILSITVNNFNYALEQAIDRKFKIQIKGKILSCYNSINEKYLINVSKGKFIDIVLQDIDTLNQYYKIVIEAILNVFTIIVSAIIIFRINVQLSIVITVL